MVKNPEKKKWGCLDMPHNAVYRGVNNMCYRLREVRTSFTCPSEGKWVEVVEFIKSLSHPFHTGLYHINQQNEMWFHALVREREIEMTQSVFVKKIEMAQSVFVKKSKMSQQCQHQRHRKNYRNCHNHFGKW
jgi:hypothetical protein